MPDSFDRDARERAKEALEKGIGERTDVDWLAIHTTVRWAVQITEGADALLSEKICDLPEGYEDSVPCSGVHRKVVWEAGE